MSNTMGITKPYVQSNYPRKEDDDYQTVDPRCVQALIETIEIPTDVRIVDCCSANGSGIVKDLLFYSRDAFGSGDAFADDLGARWIITNPPYERKIVDRIMWEQIHRIADGRAVFFAALLRNNFDFAKKRYEMFSAENDYYGQIHMMFRPWWSEERKAQPIHNYVWHIWRASREFPRVWYWRER